MRDALLTLAVLCAAAAAAHAQKIEQVLPLPGGNQPRLYGPFAIDFSGKTAYIVELEGGRIHRWDMAKGTLTTIGGQPEKKGDAGDGGPISGAVFNGMHNLAVQPGTGDIYIADTWNARIRKLDPKTGIITTVAGTGKKSFDGAGGPALKASINDIYSIDFDTTGRKLYLCALPLRRILVMDMTSGNIDLVAGNGEKGTPTDGADAKSSPLSDPRAVAVDSKGNVYILERNGNALRVVDPSGKIRTVVNKSGKKGATGDGGPAINATMNGPKHLCIDHDDTVIIADAENNLIRRYDPRNGKMTRIAGTGTKGAAGLGGDPLKCELARSHGVTVHPDGTLYICDSYNNRVLKIVR